MTPVQIALIGAGMFGRKHIEIMLQQPSSRLVAVADPAPEAAVVAKQHGVPYFADYTDMLDAVKPEGAIIATPNATHAAAGLACAARGIPMLIEKPIAETIDAAKQLVSAAERANVPLLVAHHRRHNPVIQKAREIVQGGGIGRLTAVTALCTFLKPDDYFNVAWRRQVGGGPVLINMVHDIDNLRFICGEIAAVQAFTSNAVRGFNVEDTAVVSLRFANDALGTVTVSDATTAPWSWELTAGENPMYPQRPENCYLFAGTDGALAVPKLELWRYKNERGWSAPLSCDKIDVTPEDPLIRQNRHFCRVIRGEEQPLITGADATRTLAATLAVQRAAETGKPVTLD